MDKNIVIEAALVAECKGENESQSPAGLYADPKNEDSLALHRFRRLAGPAPSYNNYCDIDRLLQTMTHMFSAVGWDPEYDQIALGAKHGNCCGAAARPERSAAVAQMVTGDARAIFGGVVMVNFPINEHCARLLLHEGSEHRRLLSAVAAPAFTDDAIEMLSGKQSKTTLLSNLALGELNNDNSFDTRPRVRHVRGGYLLQPNYEFEPYWLKATFVGPHPSPSELTQLKIAWAVGSTSNSNTVTLVKNWRLIGNGVGQQDRVGAAELALKRAIDAGHNPDGAVAYSDSFFPFPDGPLALIKKGVKVIMATSGSIRDKEVQAACEERGCTLVLFPDPEARGFFGH